MKTLTVAETDEVCALVKRAGETLLNYWPRKGKSDGKEASETRLKIEQKKDGSLVTEADYASNTILVDGLQKLFPDVGIFSEELAPKANLSSLEYAWIIDPLDGTKTFTEGNDDFSVLVSLCYKTKPVFGVMYFPARNQIAVGRQGQGAWLDGRQLGVSKNSEIGKERLYLRHLKLPPQPMFYQHWMDSGMAFFNVCRGEFDGIILKIATHQEWDLAAPAIMLEESGARITDEFGQPIQFHRAPIKFKYFVASNGLVHDQLLGMIPKE